MASLTFSVTVVQCSSSVERCTADGSRGPARPQPGPRRRPACALAVAEVSPPPPRTARTERSGAPAQNVQLASRRFVSESAKALGWTLKARSSSECMLFKERRSGNFRRSFVKIEASFGWFSLLRSLSGWRFLQASTELTFSIPDRSAEASRDDSVITINSHSSHLYGSQ